MGPISNRRGVGGSGFRGRNRWQPTQRQVPNVSGGAGRFRPMGRGAPRFQVGLTKKVGKGRPTREKRNAFALQMKLAAKGITWSHDWETRKTLKKTKKEKEAAVKNGTSTTPSSQSAPTSSAASSEKAKEQKTEEQPSEKPPPAYKESMMIVPHDYPSRELTEKEVDKLEEAVIRAFEPLEDGCFPQFRESHKEAGAVVMTCASPLTKTWLECIVPKLQPWEDAKFIVKPKAELLKPTKLLLNTPKLFAKTHPKKILQMLGHQNKTLKTGKWRVVSAQSDDSGQTLIYEIDEESVEPIVALNNRAYLGFGNVELIILPKDDDKKNITEQAADQ